jgi:hypothetical protein
VRDGLGGWLQWFADCAYDHHASATGGKRHRDRAGHRGYSGGNGVHLAAQTANLTAGALTYRWDFGDGATSSDAAPTRVFPAAGRYTVVLTVSDTTQSARAETVVTVHSLTGRWTSASGLTTMQLTQSGATITGSLSTTALSSGTVYSNCPISGTARNGTPVVLLNRPVCRHPTLNQQMVQAESRLDLDSEGQALSGVIVEPAPFGSNPVTYRRQ